MSLSILTNISAMDTHRNLQASSDAVSTAMQRLSSGLRINSAADDAAGYAIAQGLTSQVNGFDQAGRNVSDATSMVQTASGALNNVQSMLQRVSELAVQYQNGDLSSQDQTDIQSEVNQLTQEINRQQSSVQFNGINLLDGSAGGIGWPGRDLPGGPPGLRHPDRLVRQRRVTALTRTGFSWVAQPLARRAPSSTWPVRSARSATSTRRSTLCRTWRRRWVRCRTACSTPRMPSP